MQSNTLPHSRKRRSYRRSLWGCRNCKLRKVKCDEAKPHCRNCKEYGVVCNFLSSIPDLQILVTTPNAWKVNNRTEESLFPGSLSLPLVCSDEFSSFEMDARNMDSLERFRTQTLNAFGTDMIKIWRDRIPGIAFQNPYLMHVILAVSAAYSRYMAPTHSLRTHTEIYHAAQCVLLFNRKLSRPFTSSDRDPLWATAALLGLLTMASIDTVDPEEAWPLRPSSSSDLEWFWLSDGKNVVWEMTDPLRPGGIFRAMADEYAQMNVQVPEAGTEGVPTSLINICHLSDSSDAENNPYFTAAHLLARLQRTSNSSIERVQTVSFVCKSHPSFRDLLRKKDPVALVLLALWYDRAETALWWIEQRAKVEKQAIRLYLARFHYDDAVVVGLLDLLSS